VVVLVAFGEETFKRVLREELTSGDGNVRRLLAEAIPLDRLARLVRWGRDVTPTWIHGDEVIAPPANTALVSWSVPAGKVGYIYGFFISAGEGNDFKINWTSGGVVYSRRIIFPGKGTLHFVDVIALNEGLPADPGTDVTITNVNAGSAGVVYQATLLVVAV
jgi:hypothetical protein